MFGLPDGVAACLFDMDGVVTKTAIVHAAAWKQMFDDFLRTRAAHTGETFVPFDSDRDYGDFVDGRGAWCNGCEAARAKVGSAVNGDE